MTMTTDNNKSIYPDATFQPTDVVPDALILKIGTNGGSVEGDAPVVRVPYISSLPTVDFVAEGEAVDPSEPSYDEELINTRKLMLISRQSREAASHPTAASLLASSMATALIRQANRALLAGSPAESPGATLPGLAEIEGTQINGGVTANLDAIIDAMTGIETEGGTPSDIIMAPSTWASILKLKAGTGSDIPLIGSPAEMTSRRLYGCPVHVSPDVDADTMLIIDSKALITVASDIAVTVSGDAYFTSDTIARRITWRIGWGMPEPKRLAKITFTE